MTLQFSPYQVLDPSQYQKQRVDPNAITQPLMQGLQMLLQAKQQERQNSLQDQTLALQKEEAARKAQADEQQQAFEYGTKLPPLNSMTPGSTDMQGMATGQIGKSSFMPGAQGPVGTGGLVSQFRDWQERNKNRADVSSYGLEPEQLAAAGFGDLSEYSDIGSKRREQLLKLAELPRKRQEAEAAIDLRKAQADYYARRPAEGNESLLIAGVDETGQPLLVGNKTGQIRKAQVPGGGILYPKTPSESQSNAGLFGKRAIEADAQLQALVSSGVDPAALSIGVQSRLPNILKSGTAQQLDQIKRNFVSAVLRKESGAAISVPEMREAEKQYFPQAGDSPEVLKQKEINRKTAIEGLNRIAGPMAMKENSASNAQQLSPEDEQALAWAQANPNDPRAAQIRRLHGI